MVRWWRLGLAALVLAAVVIALLLPASVWGPAAPPAQQLFDLLVESKKSAEHGDKGWTELSAEARRQGASNYGRRMIALADRYPDDPAAVEALVLVVSRWGGHAPEGDQAFQRLLKHHSASPAMGELVAALSPAPKAWRTERLRELTGAATDPAVLAVAYFRLAAATDEAAAEAPVVAGPAATADQTASIANYELAAAKDPDSATGRIAQAAGAAVRRLQTVGVGRPAPPISGSDLDGQPMTLADFSGKVVLLDFWALWCQPCWREVPRYRQLVQQHAGRPFAVVGVLSEANRDFALQSARRNDVTWRNWLDPADRSSPGPINSAWGIDAFPTVFLIDGRGTLRVRGPFLEPGSLEKHVAQLLDEPPPP
jgi:thiol-disulfide isomerase/thioredoxin